MVSVVIPAAGMGTRMGLATKKQYIRVNGKEVLQWTLEGILACKDVNEIIVVAPLEECDILSKKVSEWFEDVPIIVVSGGESRDVSVYKGLKACSPDSKVVFIHDGVRPFVKGRWLTEMLQTLKSEPIDAVALGRPVTNTLKKLDNEQIIETHIDRSMLWEIETPQLFYTKDILAAHRMKTIASDVITDDTQLLSSAGKQVKLMMPDGVNFKITTLAELEIAEKILGK
jgi:2-C-methyl-D-erythritol 4-phosphate cytidylyltransferase